MAVTVHPTGGYRAYKKIQGKELQYYSKDRKKAEQKQKEFDAIALLKGKSVFSSCGRLKGTRINLYRRKGRQPTIIARVATGPFRNQTTREHRYKGNFEDFWKWMRSTWADAYGLSPQDIAGYREQIKSAKRLYLQDLGKFEQEIKQNS